MGGDQVMGLRSSATVAKEGGLVMPAIVKILSVLSIKIYSNVSFLIEFCMDEVFSNRPRVKGFAQIAISVFLDAKCL
jgi:aminoglycoside N3'-acetyltransferase